MVVWGGFGCLTPPTVTPTEGDAAHNMRIRRNSVLLAAAVAVAFAASPALAHGSAAAVAPPVPSPIDSSAQPIEPSDPQIVESWQLSPGGSDLNPGAGNNRPNLSYFSNAGELIKDSVTVFNYGNVTETFRVYATDAYNDEQGQFATLEGSKPPVDVGTWVTFDQEYITVLPGKASTIQMVIKVPVDAVPGDHVGAVVASSPTIGTGESGNILTLDRRTGTRLYIRVNGTINSDLAVANVDSTYHQATNPLGGSATVKFTIENRGNIRMSGTPTVSVGGLFGIGERKVTLPDIAELLPGQKVTLIQEVTKVPALLFNFTNVRLERKGADKPGSSEGSAISFAPPIAFLLALLALTLAVLAVRARGRRIDDSDGSAHGGTGEASRELERQSR